MVQLTKQQLYDSFPDNTDGLIDPLDMRNFVDSVELKYDNFTVVKPGQPFGNKFPDPVGDEIILDPNTYWVMNGQIVVFNTIVPGEGVGISSISGDFTLDGIFLDAAAGAKPLFKWTGGTSTIFTGLILAKNADNQTLVQADNFAALTFNNCGIAGSGPASLDQGNFTLGSILLFDRCFFLGFEKGFTIGDLNEFTVDGCIKPGQGFLTCFKPFEVTGVIQRAIITNNSFEAGIADDYLVKVVDDNTIELGVISGNIYDDQNGTYPNATFIENLDEKSINSTYTANVGIENTTPNGSIVMAANTVVTTNPGADLWTPIIGNGQDVLSLSVARFERNNPLQLTYIGKEQFKGLVTLSLSVRRATGTSPVTSSVGIFVNGQLSVQPYISGVTSITNVGTLASVTLAAPFLGLKDGQQVGIFGANESDYNGFFTITNVNAGAGTFDYTMPGDPGGPATGILAATLPVEVVMPVSPEATAKSVTIAVPVFLNEGDVIRPYIRGDGHSVDHVVEGLAFSVT